MAATNDLPSDDVWAVVVAAGSGQRFGGAKQFAVLAGERILDRSVAACRSVCGGVVVVLSSDALGTPEAEVPGADAVVAGGATRSESVRQGLAAVPDSATLVLVHDAARPLVTPDVCARVVDALRAGATAVVPAVPVTDTVRTVAGDVLDRSQLRAVQTPQGFQRAALVAAHATRADATDDAGLMELLGEQVVLVDGDPDNLKITGPSDLAVAAALLGLRGGSGAATPGAGD
ncbi:MAG: 2-C-methyl-D-erythritol 4-phosphate cytidylyltransferase [Actinomycetes bacterium]